jgi:hypothetical protein
MFERVGPAVDVAARSIVSSPYGGWTPASLLVGATAGWYRARGTGTAGLTFNTQIPLVNGDIETGDTTGWTPSNATITAVAGSRPGGSGSYVLEITRTGSSGLAQQSILVVGNHYRVRGWFRGDGTNACGVYVGGVLAASSGPSTTWSYFDVEVTAATAVLAFVCSATVGNSCYVDDVSIENLSLTQVDPTAAVGTLVGLSLTQSVPTNMQWNAGGSLRAQDASTDYMQLGGVGDHSFLWDGSGGTIAFRRTITDASTLAVYMSSMEDNNTNKGVLAYQNSGNLVLRIGAGSGVFAFSNTSVGTVATGTYTFILRVGGGVVSLRRNGTSLLSGALGATGSGDATYALTEGNIPSRSYSGYGDLESMLVVSRAISDDDCVRLEAYWS